MGVRLIVKAVISSISFYVLLLTQILHIYDHVHIYMHTHTCMHIILNTVQEKKKTDAKRPVFNMFLLTRDITHENKA